MIDYFDFFGLDVRILINEADLKEKFYANTRKFHPDMHGNTDENNQTEVLAKSVLNNKAYKTLSNFNLRVHHLLEVSGLVNDELKYQLPQEFLMEMMDLNDEIAELDDDIEDVKQLDLIEKINHLIGISDQEILENDLKITDNEQLKTEKLNKIRELYFKKKYLLRIQDSLNKFVIRS